jgi:hypothetical protein
MVSRSPLRVAAMNIGTRRVSNAIVIVRDPRFTDFIMIGGVKSFNDYTVLNLQTLDFVLNL